MLNLIYNDVHNKRVKKSEVESLKQISRGQPKNNYADTGIDPCFVDIKSTTVIFENFK